MISEGAPIIRRFDLDGNLLQQINIAGDIVNKKHISAFIRRQKIAHLSSISTDTYLRSPYITEGHKLLVYIHKFGALELHYNDKDIIYKKIIKCEIETEDNNVVPWGIIKNDNIMLLYQSSPGKLFINKE